MNVKQIGFSEFNESMKESNGDGIVLLGAGGPADEWIDGVTGMLHDKGIVSSANPEEVWGEAFKLSTSGGRTDLALTFNSKMEFKMGMMAMWRIGFGDCSWISDYVVNYQDQHIS
ncbi:gp597 [Bacillus phage G]|uniref:Gp597 n=1 Tax=Bacillus phage G TaxID=2884420 RepID=G3MAX7_9CAUD|nr:gp597 [Bacillus phage G]AEO93842.1 gp597 [Bacillus phage G]